MGFESENLTLDVNGAANLLVSNPALFRNSSRLTRHSSGLRIWSDTDSDYPEPDCSGFSSPPQGKHKCQPTLTSPKPYHVEDMNSSSFPAPYHRAILRRYKQFKCCLS